VSAVCPRMHCLILAPYFLVFFQYSPLSLQSDQFVPNAGRKKKTVQVAYEGFSY
jgi:hypothetical protein